MSQPVMMIIPAQNGYIVQPFDSDLLTSMKRAMVDVRVAANVEELKVVIEDVYASSVSAPDPGSEKK